MQKRRKLGRPTAHRLAMLRALVTCLLESGRIETTVPKAKEVRSMTEKMITLAKDNSLAHKRMAYGFITKKDVVKKPLQRREVKATADVKIKKPVISAKPSPGSTNRKIGS